MSCDWLLIKNKSCHVYIFSFITLSLFSHYYSISHRTYYTSLYLFYVITIQKSQEVCSIDMILKILLELYMFKIMYKFFPQVRRPPA